MLDEVDSALKFAEDSNSLSGVFCPNDAPLVNISDICSGFSMDAADSVDSPPEVVCENCRKVSFRDRPTSSGCQCKENGSVLLPVLETPPVILTRASTTDDTVSSSSQHTVIPLRQPPKPSEATTNFHAMETARVQPAPSPKNPDVASTDDEIEDFGQPDPMTCRVSDLDFFRIATMLDVAVIRALLITHWHEQGIYWAMRYLLNRLEQIQIGLSSYSNTTWENFQLKTEEDDKSKLHVAFNDSRSDPSLNNSCEILSIREDSASVSNASSKSEKVNERIAAKFYPEALGSSSFIERNGRISLTVIVQTINQVMERNGMVRLCELALNIADTLLRIPIDQTETFFSQLTMMVF
ncbi:hypothetical protein ANCDUO_14456, partial [Ancylostoma duodenale]